MLFEAYRNPLLVKRFNIAVYCTYTYAKLFAYFFGCSVFTRLKESKHAQQAVYPVHKWGYKRKYICSCVLSLANSVHSLYIRLRII
jgi:hypothetical protein